MTNLYESWHSKILALTDVQAKNIKLNAHHSQVGIASFYENHNSNSFPYKCSSKEY